MNKKYRRERDEQRRTKKSTKKLAVMEVKRKKTKGETSN